MLMDSPSLTSPPQHQPGGRVQGICGIRRILFYDICGITSGQMGYTDFKR